MGESMDISVSGGTVTALTLGYEFNLLGSLTTLSGKKTQVFVPINDDLVEKEIPKVEFDINGWIGNLAIGIIATVALAAVATVAVGAVMAASVVTFGAGLAAFAAVGAAVGAGIVTASIAISDVASGNVRSWKEAAAQTFMGAVLGAAAGATIHGMISALPAAAQAVGLEFSMKFGVSKLSAIVIPKLVEGFGIVLTGMQGLFLGNEISTMASGVNLLLKTVFGNNQAAYDNTFMAVEMLSMGMVQLGQDNAALGKQKNVKNDGEIGEGESQSKEKLSSRKDKSSEVGIGTQNAADTKENFQNKINNVRNQMPNSKLKNQGNMAVADVDIDGLPDEFIAHSKIHSLESTGADVADFSFTKENKIFETYVVDKFPRLNDTEAKILEDIASKIKDSNISGTINLYTELPTCQSCTNIIFEFKRKFPNIKLNIFSGN